MAKRYKTKGQT